MTTICRIGLCLAFAFAIIALPLSRAQTPLSKPPKVTIEENKTEFNDRVLPLDPAIRVGYEYVGMMSFGVNSDGKRLTCGAGSAGTSFKIDGQVFYPEEVLMLNKGGGRPVMPAPPLPLPPGPYNRKRTGMQSTWSHGEVKITMILEVVPSKPTEKIAGTPQKRRMDTLLVKYTIENNDAKSHSVGARMYIDTMCGNNDGAIFASPTTHPGMLLDGVMFQDKNVPEFIEMLEIPNLKNPGFKGVFTFKMGNKIEAPNKVVLTNMGAFGDWDVPAIPALGDSAVAFFWDPKEIKAKSKREIAFAIGQGIAANPENEGKVAIQFGGSFEPKKTFTVTAYVEDPIEGQSLTLDLPRGIERLDGKVIQTVPPPARDDGHSVVMWRCRVLEMGTFPIRIHSSNGVTETRIVTVAPGQ